MKRLLRLCWPMARRPRARVSAGRMLVLTAMLWPAITSAQPSARWTFGFDGALREDSAARLVAAGANVFIAGRTQLADESFETFIAALDARSGRLIWRTELDLAGDLERARDLSVVADQLIVGSDGHRGSDCTLALMDARTGKLRWQISLDRETRGRRLYALTANADTVFAATGDERAKWAIEARATSDGTMRWADDGSGPEEPRRLTPRDLTLAGDLLVTVGSERTNEGADPLHRTLVRAHDARTGEVRWQYPTPGLPDADELGMKVAAAQGVVVVASQERDADAYRAVVVRGLDVETGELQWQSRLTGDGEEVFAHLQMAPPFVVVGTNARSGATQSGWLRRLGLDDGRIHWETKTSRGDRDTKITALTTDRSEVLVGGAIWPGAGTAARPNAARGWALALDLATGASLWEQTLDSTETAGGVTTLALVDGDAYLAGWGNPDGHANAIVRSLGPPGRPRVLPRRGRLPLGDAAPGRGAPGPRRQRIPEQTRP